MSANPAQPTEPQEFSVVSDYQFTGNSFTVERKCKFISALREYGSIFHTAQVCEVSRRAVYDWIEADQQFAQAVTDIREDNYDDLETSVYKRAFKSDLLAMFYLKAHRPKYRDKLQIDVAQVQDDIEQFMSRYDQRQLPAAMSEFIDTSYSQGSYEPVVEDTQTQQIPSQPQIDQKEDSPSES